MTYLFHCAFMKRFAKQVGDQITFDDGLPPPTEEELSATYDAALAEWNQQQNPPKRWVDTQAFLAEFSMEELSAISLSNEPTIAALRLLLSGWRSEVHSDDSRVTQGITALFINGIINEQRMAEIMS